MIFYSKGVITDLSLRYFNVIQKIISVIPLLFSLINSRISNYTDTFLIHIKLITISFPLIDKTYIHSKNYLIKLIFYNHSNLTYI